MTTTTLSGGGNFFPDLFKIATVIGVMSSSTVILGGAYSGAINYSNADWRDYAVWGALGSIIGARWSMHGPWWKGY